MTAVVGGLGQDEEFPLERAAEGHARMMSGDARFRVVLDDGEELVS